jgi:hypothetical protein
MVYVRKSCRARPATGSWGNPIRTTVSIDYRCDKRRFWLSAHSCQVPTPTSQNLELEQQIRICEADELINCLEDIEIHNS